MRKPITKRMAVDALLLRVFVQFGAHLKCALSGEDMKPGDAIQFDHIHADALGGPHVYDNLRPVLAKPHQKKTKADLRMIKKTRPGHTETFVVRKVSNLLRTVIAESKPKRPWPKGRKMQSRPFEKRKAS